MRSYYAHLTTTNPELKKGIADRPVFRTSAIFPAFQQKNISSRILFMGYWILKRNISEMSAIATLRNIKGETLSRNSFSITEAKTFSIELKNELKRAGFKPDIDFLGTLEIEFFSSQNLHFPYPAVVINYYGPKFSTVVHTAQRIYNDLDDQVKNSQTEVPESGFNIYADDSSEPFISLINGPIAVPRSKMQFEFINHEQKLLDSTINLGNLAPYELKVIYPARHVNLKSFLMNKPGTAKAHFQINGAFPRLIVGNLHHNIPALTITHSYYDCSSSIKNSDYWQPKAGWHVLALMLPGEIASQHFTNIYFYPIYSPSTFAIDAEIYDAKGLLLGVKKDAIVINAPHMEFHSISLNHLCKTLNISSENDCALRLIARPIGDKLIPARIKIGLDVGTINPFTPCNICTNLQPFNPSLEQKPSSFRWAPVLADQPGATLWLMNSSPAISYHLVAEITVTFFRESDAQTIVRNIVLPPHGFAVIRVHEDKELECFFENKVGWMTAKTTNPFTTTYYFAENPSGVVGGDHGF